jgi:uncharacterized delta-60 repeat protein
MNRKATPFVISPLAKLLGPTLALLSLVGPVHSQTADPFNPGADGYGSYVCALAVQPDGRIVAGGLFTSLGGTDQGVIGRLNADGTLDYSTFHPWVTHDYTWTSPSVSALAVQAEGKILVGGHFTKVDGQPRDCIARLNADGTLDATFNPGAKGWSVYSLAVQADGKILVGGWFGTLGGQTRNNLGRLNADGTLDTTFNSGADYLVYSLAVQVDGKIVVGGSFTNLAGQTRNCIGRLNADGTLDSTFNPGASSDVYSLVVQGDGRILVGGSFTTLGGQTRNRIGRLDAGGTLDTTFNPGADSTVYSLAVQADGRILVGGSFTTLGEQIRNRIGRLDAGGTLDTTFNPGADSTVYSLAVQADGKILVGGSFTNLAGQTRNRIGRLNNTEPATQNLSYDGATIAWLRGGSSPEVWRITFEHSGDGLTWTNLGGGTRIPGGWQLAGVSVPPGGTLRARGYVIGGQYNASGWFVETYGGALVFITQPASRTNVAGTTATFSTLAGGTEPLGYQWCKDGVALADGGNLTGALVPTLTVSNVLGSEAGGYCVVVSNALGSVTSAVAKLTIRDPFLRGQPTSQLKNPGERASFCVTAVGATPLGYQWRKEGVPLAGASASCLSLSNLQAANAGNYDVVVTNVFGTLTSVVAELSVNLALPDSFNPGAYDVQSLAVQADGKVLVGGRFTTLGGQSRNYLGRLNANGTLDSTFNPGAGGDYYPGVYSVAVQADGKILVGGVFNTLGGQSRTNLGRLNADGTLDSTFNVGANGGVRSLALQADGKMVVGGGFTTLGGQPRNRIGRLNADGTLDSTFNPGAQKDVYSLAVQADGKIVVGGTFTNLAGQTRNRIGRLNAGGMLDNTFNPGASSSIDYLTIVRSLVEQADGKIVVGGYFNTLGGQTRNCIGRLNADGTLDSTFNPGAQKDVYSLGVQADGKILVGGSFNTLGGQTRNGIGRLNADGTLDGTFNPGILNPEGASPEAYSLAVQEDGKVLVGGYFTMLGGQPRNYLGRLSSTEPATQSLNCGGSTITWLRGGTSPDVWRTTFEHSGDGLTWTNLGAGRRIPGGCELAGVSLPSGGTLRARGYVTAGGVSSWFVEACLGLAASAERFVSLTLERDGSLHTTIIGPPNRSFALQGTPDLSHWTELGRYTNETGTLVLTNDPPAGQDAYFYRTVFP